MPGTVSPLANPLPGLLTPATPVVKPAPIATPAVNPDAKRLADYLDQLHATGYGMIDPAVQVATAQGAINHPAHVGAMDAIRTGMANAYKSVGQFFTDPSVEQPATDTQRINDHLTGTGIQPIQPPLIKQVQQDLITRGYGNGMPANGAWSADWNSEQYRANSDKQHQSGFGQLSARDMILGPLMGMLWSHAIPLVKSMAISTLEGVGHTIALGASNAADILTGQASDRPSRGTASDLMFPLAGLMNLVGGQKTGTKPSAPTPPQIRQMQQDLQTKGYGKGLPVDGSWTPDWNSQYYQMRSDEPNQPKSISLGDQIGAAIQSATNLINHTGHVSAEQYMDTPVGWNDAVTVIGTALTLSSLGTFAKAGKLGITGAVDTGMRAGASSAAKAMITPVSKEEAGAAGKTLMNSVLPQIGTQGFRRFAFTKSLQNMPTQNFITGLNMAATDLGKYWEIARTPIVQAYRLPAVQAAGKIGVALGNVGFKGTVIGEGEKLLGDPNGPQAQTLDHLQPIAGWQGAVLNGLQLTAHQPLGTPGFKQEIGDKIGAANTGISQSLNESGATANWERVMHDNHYPGYRRTVADAAQRGVPASAVDASIYDGINQQAAWHQATIDWQHHIQNAADTVDSSQRFRYIQNVSHVIRNDPQLMNEARTSYLLVPGQYAADLQRGIVNMKADPTYSYSGDFISKLASDEVMRNQIIPLQEHLITPDSMAEGVASRRMAVDEVKRQTEAGLMRDPVLYTKYAQQLSGLDANALTSVYQAFKDGRSMDYTVPAKLSRAEKAALLKGGQMPVKPPVQMSIQRPANQATFLEAFKDRIATSGYATDVPEWAHRPDQAAAVAADAQKTQTLKDIAASIPSLELPPKFMGKATLDDARLAAMNGDGLAAGKLGRTKIERQSSGDAQAKANEFANEFAEINPAYKVPESLDEYGKAPDVPYDPFTSVKGENLLREKILHYMGSELNINIKDLNYTSTPHLLELIIDKSHDLAADVHVANDAPEALKAAVEALNKLGYKLTWGTDIGHAFTNAPMDLNVLGKQENLLQHAADKLGLNFTHVDPHVAAAHADATMLNTIQDAMNAAATGKYPVWATADRMVGYLRGAIRPDMNLVSSTAFNLAASRMSRVIRPIKGSMWRTEINRLMEGGMTRPEAKAAIQKGINKDVGPIFWTRRQVTDALTRSGPITNNFGEKVDAPGMSLKAASDFYYAMQKGLRATPAWVGGVSPFIRALDSTFGFANLPAMLPNGRRILDLTGDIKPVLMSARYQASYRFAFLRVIKSAAKGVTENIPFTMDARASMKAMGISDEAYILRDAYLGTNPRAREVSDYVNQEFDKADMFNVYNPRAIEARNIWYLHQQALEDAGGDITKIDPKMVLNKLDEVFTYGSRTAAEKSVNAFFFPFSFEKTIARQLGGHLLDHPAARLATAGLVAAYNSADGQNIKKWMETNLPLFKEAEKFNPFYHGIGLGQTGGILRLPEDIARQLFVEMMSPKPITTIASAKAVFALVPAIRDLNKILIGVDPSGKKPFNPGGEMKDSLRTLQWEAGRGMSWLRGDPSPDNWGQRGYLSYDNQMTAAWDLRTQVMTKLATALAANRSGDNYLWPDTLPATIRGTKISAESISQLVHYVYPKWEPALITQYVEQRRTASYDERASIEHVAPNYVPMYELWIQKADTIASLISRQSIDVNTLATYTTIMRSYAAQLMAQDPMFKAFYKRYYASKFGPLGGL